VKQLARELDGEVVRALLGLTSEKANGKGGDGEKAENGTTVCPLGSLMAPRLMAVQILQAKPAKPKPEKVKPELVRPPLLPAFPC
jgi:hypothetical protein